MHSSSRLAFFQDVLAVAFAVVLFSGANTYLRMPIFDSTLWVILGLTAVFAKMISESSRIIPIRPLSFWVYCFVLVSSVGIFVSSDRVAAIETFQSNVVFCLILMIVYVLFSSSGALNAGLRVLALVNILSVANNIYEFFVPGTYSVAVGRAAGFYQNPNASGAALSVGMALTAHIVPPRWRLAYQLSIGVGVFVTFSRGALACWAVVFAIQQFWTSRRRGKEFWQSAATLCLLLPIIALTPMWDSFQGALTDDSSIVAGNLDRLGEGSEARVEVAQDGWRAFSERPVLGHGTGRPLFETRQGMLGAHNTYLSLAVQHGLIGLLLLPGMAALLAVSRFVPTVAVATMASILIAALFSHLVLAQWQYAVAIALTFRVAELLPTPSLGGDDHVRRRPAHARQLSAHMGKA